MLSDLRQDRPLHEGLSQETQVCVCATAGGCDGCSLFPLTEPAIGGRPQRVKALNKDRYGFDMLPINEFVLVNEGEYFVRVNIL